MQLEVKKWQTFYKLYLTINNNKKPNYKLYTIVYCCMKLAKKTIFHNID